METNKNYKRQFRELEPDVKAKISQGLKHKSKTPTHRANISAGMTQYWQSVPHKPYEDKPSPTETGEVI